MFKEIYHNNNLQKLLITEINKKLLIKNTDSVRAKKSDTVITRSPLIKEVEPGISRLEYNFKSNPSVENQRHYGFVEFNDKTGDILKVWCNCKDFYYRLYYSFEKNDLSTWNLDNKFKNKEPFNHNHQHASITNPMDELYLCKHLYSLLQNYLN